MGNKSTVARDSWTDDERGGGYRIKYRRWRLGQAEGGPFDSNAHDHAAFPPSNVAMVHTSSMPNPWLVAERGWSKRSTSQGMSEERKATSTTGALVRSDGEQDVKAQGGACKATDRGGGLARVGAPSTIGALVRSDGERDDAGDRGGLCKEADGGAGSCKEADTGVGLRANKRTEPPKAQGRAQGPGTRKEAWSDGEDDARGRAGLPDGTSKAARARKARDNDGVHGEDGPRVPSLNRPGQKINGGGESGINDGVVALSNNNPPTHHFASDWLTLFPPEAAGSSPKNPKKDSSSDLAAHRKDFSNTRTAQSTGTIMMNSATAAQLAASDRLSVFPPEANSSPKPVPSTHKKEFEFSSENSSVTSVNEMIKEELCRSVTDELVGPEFTQVSASPLPIKPEVAVSAIQTTGETPIITATQEAIEGSITAGQRPQVKLVVNHLYVPVFKKVRDHLAGLPDWYTAKTPPREVADHVRTLLEARRSGPNTVAVSVHPQVDYAQRVLPGYFIVVVCARDQRQLLDSITRCVSSRASISEATIITTKEGFALDRFVLSLRPDDVDEKILMEDLNMWGLSLKKDIDDVLKVILESPSTSPARTAALCGGGQPPMLSLDGGSGGSNVGGMEYAFAMAPNSSLATSAVKGATPKLSSKRKAGGSATSSPVIPPLSLAGSTTSAATSTQLTQPPQPPLMAASQVVPKWEVPFQEIRLVRVLGEGRTGKTFLAEWNGNRVAAKVLNVDEDAQDLPSNKFRSNLDEFRRELHLVSKLNHPNVVKFIGASSRPPRYVILFELCEGGDVGQLIRAKDVKYSFFQIALDIASGLAFLHRSGVIHRDVKPENLMLDRNRRVKIADFGLSCYATGAAAEITAETGTYRYMAPEVMRHEHYFYPADVYSFALVCSVLLSKRLPFDELTPIQAAMAVVRQDARPKLPSNTPKQLTDLIRACWSREQSRRPDSDRVVLALTNLRLALNNRERKTFDWGFHGKSASSALANMEC